MDRLIGLITCFAGTLAILQPLPALAQQELLQNQESLVKFAFYSSAWGENTDDGLRMVAHNQTDKPIQIDSIVFHSTSEELLEVTMAVGLDVPSMGYAEREFKLINLLAEDDECIIRTMAENWKLVEISNYTLNPSVRNLIIENTDSFRIYQCVRTITTSWTDLSNNQQSVYEEWVLYHFERRREF